MNTEQQKAHIFGTLFVIANKLQKLGDRIDPDVTVKQWLFIAAVDRFEQAPTITELASFIGYSRQNAKRIALALAQLGMVELATDAQDRRAQRVSITDACREHFAQRTRQETAFVESLFGGMDDGEVSALFSLIGKLESAIGSMELDDECSKED